MCVEALHWVPLPRTVAFYIPGSYFLTFFRRRRASFHVAGRASGKLCKVSFCRHGVGRRRHLITVLMELITGVMNGLNNNIKLAVCIIDSGM